MIPIRDTVSSRTYPLVTHILIGINAVLFLVEMAQGPNLERFIYYYGLVPAKFTVPEIAAYFSVGQNIVSLVTFMFLHGGFLHLLGNMWFLYIFGDNVEDRLGHLRYLSFYLLCGIGSGLSHLFLNPQSTVPTIGASGSIAGIMGAYFVLYPHSRILTLIPIIIIPYFVEIPAFFFLGFWMFLQFINAAGSRADVSGVAWWAHIGGFIIGVLLLKVFELIPAVGADQRMRQATLKRRSHHLQVIRPVGTAEDLQLYGTLNITPFEARNGSRKMVNIPWGFHKRLLRIAIPPGMKEGSVLRLKGLGKEDGTGGRGDLLLKVSIQPAE